MYPNIFHGCCYILNNYGHKAIHFRVNGKYTLAKNRGMFSFQVLCYNYQNYGHFAKECMKVWRRKFEEKRNKEKSEEEGENHVYEVETRMLEEVSKEEHEKTSIA